MSRRPNLFGNKTVNLRVYKEDHAYLLKHRGAMNLHDINHVVVKLAKDCESIPGFPGFDNMDTLDKWFKELKARLGVE